VHLLWDVYFIEFSLHYGGMDVGAGAYMFRKVGMGFFLVGDAKAR
jgi:hypothetical protein